QTREADVDHDHGRPETLRRFDGAAAVADLADDFDLGGGLENLAQALTDDRVVFGEQHARFRHGSAPFMVARTGRQSVASKRRVTGRPGRLSSEFALTE